MRFPEWWQKIESAGPRARKRSPPGAVAECSARPPGRSGHILRGVVDRAGEAELDLTRLGPLGAHLGQPPAAIAAALHAELVGALAAIDAGLDAGDLEAVGRAAHAARNSALMIVARPTLAALDAVEAAVRDDDLRRAHGARDALRGVWPRLARRLVAAAGETT